MPMIRTRDKNLYEGRGGGSMTASRESESESKRDINLSHLRLPERRAGAERMQ